MQRNQDSSSAAGCAARVADFTGAGGGVSAVSHLREAVPISVATREGGE